MRAPRLFGPAVVAAALFAWMVMGEPVSAAPSTNRSAARFQQTNDSAYQGIAVDGDCKVGACPPTAHSATSNLSVPVDFTITVADGDRFHVAGVDHQSNHSCAVEAAMDVSIQYLGNATGGASGPDTLDLDLYRSFTCAAQDPQSTFTPSGRFGPNIAAGSSVEFTAHVLPEIHEGPFAAPKAFGVSIPVHLPVSGGVMQWHNTYSLMFGAGSSVGAYIILNQGRAPPPVPLPKLVLDWATSTDGQTVDIYYTVSGADFTQPITLTVYRAAEPNPTAFDSANQLGVTIIDPSQLSLGSRPARVESLVDPGLKPNSKLPYVIGVATPDTDEMVDATSVTKTYFRKYLLGAVVHGLAWDAARWRTWMADMANALKAKDGFDEVITHDWVKHSTIPAPGEATAQGPVLFNALEFAARRLLGGSQHRGDTVDVHLFGHSRGTVVEAATLCNFPKADCDPELFPKSGTLRGREVLNGANIEVTLLDPHPANDNPKLISSGAGADVPGCEVVAAITGETCLHPLESGYANVLAFEQAVQDPEPSLPGNIGIRDVDLWFQKTSITGCSGQTLSGEEFWLNLLGEGEVGYNSSEASLATHELTCRLLDDGTLIGHREVPDCYLEDVVEQGLVDTGTTDVPDCGGSIPPMEARTS